MFGLHEALWKLLDHLDCIQLDTTEEGMDVDIHCALSKKLIYRALLNTSTENHWGQCSLLSLPASLGIIASNLDALLLKFKKLLELQGKWSETLDK